MSADAGEWTIGRLLEWTSGRLAQAGISEARLDTEILLSTAIGGRRIDLYAQHGRVALPEERARFRDMVRRRLDREPVSHIVGKREFYGLELKVDARVLIPRPETELVVDEARACLKGISAPLVVDVGTGSGAILLAILRHVPGATGVGVDRSEGALELARTNAESHALATRVQWRHGSLLEGFTAPSPPAIVTANLPYIPTAEIAGLDPEVRREPLMALDGGLDGLDLVRALAIQSETVLPTGGWLVQEVGAGQGDEVARWLSGRGWKVKPAIRDGGGHWRVVSASRQQAGAD